jgi:3-deoxy-manno-octulosonate cytidylyltransferase (CMP-KDO synthetase)
MVVHTAKRARLAKSLDAVYLATDSQRIRDAAEARGIDVIMTGSHHPTGTDRLAEAVRLIQSRDREDQSRDREGAVPHVEADITVNIQGDEPLVDPDNIDAVVRALLNDPSIHVALGATPSTRANSSSDIKAVLDLRGNILYCSREDLPSAARTPVDTFVKLCFIVAFRTPFLLQFAAWGTTPLERVEYNEYLRILEHGEKIRAVMFENAAISVDTPEDLEIVRELMSKDRLRHAYMS